MISDIKLGLKMLSFGHGKKTAAVAAIIMVLLGGATLVVGRIEGNTITFGGYLPGAAALYIGQVLFSVNVAGLVAASPGKKRLQTSIPAILNTLGVFLGYAVYCLLEIILYFFMPEQIEYMGSQAFMTIFFLAAMLLYASACYKAFYVSMILFFATFFSLAPLLWTGKFFLGWPVHSLGQFLQVIALGAVILLCSGALSYLLARILYPLPVSKASQAATLRQNM